MGRRAEYDVIVVGAGPAGSATSALLAQRGFSVLLTDRAAFPRDKACGEYSSSETTQVLARIGALEEVEKAGGRRLGSMRVISPKGQTFSMDYAAMSDTVNREVLATTRRVLDATLVDFARKCGADVLERTKIDGVTLRDGRAAGVICRKRDGTTEEIKGRLIIGADGVHSVVVRSLGLGAPLRWPQNIGMVAHYKGYNGLDDWGEMHVSPRGYAGLAPQSGGLVNVGLVMPMSRARRQNGQSALERFESFAMSFPEVRPRLDGAERVSPVRGVGPIGARVKRTFGPGYLLVGDAAGFFDPFTGEGVYKALRGAELAAEVAAAALDKGDLSAHSLARYGKMRRDEFLAKEMVCRFVQTLVGLPPAMDYVVSRLARREDTRRIMAEVLGDFGDPRAALTPRYLWSMLRP
ncbi:MAG: NAD(P)/FAD-dependent oxidoreductase [Chloroflexota bacterium]